MTGIWRCVELAAEGLLSIHTSSVSLPGSRLVVGEEGGGGRHCNQELAPLSMAACHESRASSALHSSPRSSGIHGYPRWRSPSLTSASRAAVFNPLLLNAVKRILPHSDKSAVSLESHNGVILQMGCSVLHFASFSANFFVANGAEHSRQCSNRQNGCNSAPFKDLQWPG